MGHGDEDLVTGTPIINEPKTIRDIPVWFNKNIEIFKIVQRVLMVLLTVGLLFTMVHVGNEIVTMRNELTKCRATIETMKTEITKLTTEINKGLRIRIF